MSAIHEQLTDLLATHLGVPAGKAEPEVSYQDLGLDSLALIEFTMIVNREFGTEIDDDRLLAGTTIAETVELIASQGVRA